MQHIKWTNFLSQELPSHYKQELYSIIADAYADARAMGRYSPTDNESSPLLLAPLESERLADSQGLCVQSYLHKWASGHPELSAGFEANRRKRQHVEIRTKRALLTAHRVPCPKSFPPSACYRESNAERNHLWLPHIPHKERHSSEAYLYLLHGPSLNDSSQLGFVRLAMPNPDEKSYLASYDIYTHTDFSISNQVEEIQDTAVISLKVSRDKESAL